MIDPRPTTPKDATSKARLRIALAHDWLCGRRGGEHVLEHIAQIIHDTHAPAGLYVMFDDRQPIGPAVDRIPHHVSRLGSLPGASTRARRWLLPLYPSAVRDLSRQLATHHRDHPIDLLLSTSSAAIKGLKPPPGVPHLCYCHCPARYVWSRMDEYTSAGGLGALGLKRLGPRFRRWDRATANNVTHFLANSTYTQSEIKASYGRDATVVHPPAETTFFTPNKAIKREDHWLVVSALEPYKRVDLAIDAANSAGHPLTIVGDGTQRASLEKRAGTTVTFTGRIDNQQLRDHYQRARLLIYPQIEDFGIIAVEAQACGCPVVARNTGGSRDTVRPDQTGSLFNEPTTDALLDAIARCPANADAACRTNALRFSPERFIEKIRAQIESSLAPQDQKHL